MAELENWGTWLELAKGRRTCRNVCFAITRLWAGPS